jgi:hypothetical protein
MFICGCEELFLNRGDLTTVNDNVVKMSEMVDGFQNVMTEYGKLNVERAEDIKKINNAIDVYQPIVKEAAEKIAEAPTIIEGAIETNKVTAPVNPYAGIINAVLLAVAGLGTAGTARGIVKVKKVVKEKDKEHSKRKATDLANEVLRLLHPEIATEHYNLVGSARAGTLTIPTVDVNSNVLDTRTL